jgi:hypothetical protein
MEAEMMTNVLAWAGAMRRMEGAATTASKSQLETISTLANFENMLQLTHSDLHAVLAHSITIVAGFICPGSVSQLLSEYLYI